MSERGRNLVMLLRRLGQDPEVRYQQDQTPVATFSLATPKSWKDKQSNEWKESVDWHRIVAFDKHAEIASQYLKQGSRVDITGRLQTRSWEKDGVKKYVTEIIVTNLILIQGTAESSKSANSESTPAADQQATPTQFSGFDDDIPF